MTDGRETTTVAVVGAGIVGLAHAWAAARTGCRVIVFERDAAACGASVRNFGMVWPVGQPVGDRLEIALRSRELWIEFAESAGLWFRRCGSIHLARREDELAVLEEFAAKSGDLGYDCRLLTADEVLQRSPIVNRDGLLAGLWSETELGVDPRAALSTLPRWLAERHGVEFRFGTAVVHVQSGSLTTSSGERVAADHVVVCSGRDFETLFPDVYAESGLVRCKLQMLRTVPQAAGVRIGPHLAGGLTLRHYDNFAICDSLPALRKRVAEERPELDRYGIHVMAAQNELGEIVLGDSHEYGKDVNSPFGKAAIDRLILDELHELLQLPDWSIAARWHGVYAKHPADGTFVAEPLPGVRIVSGVGGAGMTLSFGLAERHVTNWLN